MELQKSQAEFALSMTKQLFSNHDKNLVFSPLSLHVVLSVMAAGSEGRTRDELLSFLRFDSADHLTASFSHLLSALFSDDDDHLSFANGIWAHKSLPLSHSFKQLVATHYKSTLASLDFQKKGDKVRRQVNSWVEKETSGLITDLLPPMEASKSTTRLLFANALHFKGAWKHKFHALLTDFNHFHLLNGTSVEVPFMKSKMVPGHKLLFIRAFDGFKVLRLSYKQGSDRKRRFSMYIYLPDAKDGLPVLIEKLASQSGFLEDTFPRRKVRVGRFMIPKFNISFSLEASHVLKELGVVSPFSERDADFTKMVDASSPLDKLFVENIFHKTSIEVNEQGTVAAASTIMRGTLKCRPAIPIGTDFVADHPFLFLIREDFSGTILFIGQVLNPLDGAPTPIIYDWDEILSSTMDI